MPATLILDTIEGASLEEAGWQKSRTRAGIVTDIPIDPAGPTDSEVLAKARDAVYAVIDPGDLWPGDTQLRFRRLQVIPITHNAARVVLGYDTDLGGLITSYIIRDDAFEETVRTSFVPGTRAPLRVDWTNPADPTDHIVDTITFEVSMPIRAVSVTSVNLGSPPTGYQDAVCYVNEGEWMGKATGFWKLARFRSDLAKYQGSYQIEAVAVTRNFLDWSEVGYLRDLRTGWYVETDPADVASMNAETYQRGQFFVANGMTRWGPFPTTDFGAIFGFS